MRTILRQAKVTLAIAGLKKRYGTKERRRPVTPAMLRWLHAHLWAGHLTEQEASLQWASVSFAFFFLRASASPPKGGYEGKMSVRLFRKGVPCKYGEIGQADEVPLPSAVPRRTSTTAGKYGTTSDPAWTFARCKRLSAYSGLFLCATMGPLKPRSSSSGIRKARRCPER